MLINDIVNSVNVVVSYPCISYNDGSRENMISYCEEFRELWSSTPVWEPDVPVAATIRYDKTILMCAQKLTDAS